MKCSFRTIAIKIGCSDSTVSREIRHNATEYGYCPEQAQQRSDQCRHSARLRERWSPPQIAGIMRRCGYLLTERLTQLKAEPTAQAIIRQFQRIRGAVTTLTLDNGFEFAGH